MSATTIFRRNFLILSRCLLNNFNNNGHFNKISSREGVRILNNNNINNKYNFINSKNIRFIHGLGMFFFIRILFIKNKMLFYNIYSWPFFYNFFCELVKR